MYFSKGYGTFIILTLVACVYAWRYQCPTICPKCICRPQGGDKLNNLQCRHLDYKGLQYVLNASSGHIYYKFVIQKVKLTEINETLFPNISINTLYIDNSTIETFHLFNGLRPLRNMVTLTLKAVNVKRWELTSADESEAFNQLREFNLRDCPDANWDYSEIIRSLPENLTSIAIVWAGLRSEENFSFQQFANLQKLDLSFNRLTTIQRNDFPRPAWNLSLFNLSHNPISSLPDDMFVDMPALRIVYIDWTLLAVLPRDAFKPILNQLTSLEVANNQLVCNCSNSWITSKVLNWKGNIPKCVSPELLRNKRIDTLNPTQLCHPLEEEISEENIVGHCRFLLDFESLFPPVQYLKN